MTDLSIDELKTAADIVGRLSALVDGDEQVADFHDWLGRFISLAEMALDMSEAEQERFVLSVAAKVKGEG